MTELLYKALIEREKSGNPIQAAIVGAGYIGRGAIIQASYMKGIRVAAIINRTVDKAILSLSGCKEPLPYKLCSSAAEVDRCIFDGVVAISDNYQYLLDSKVDIVIDTTGDPEYGAMLAVDVIRSRKNILSPPELDIAIGPVLAKMATEHGVVYSGHDGDEPGVIMKLYYQVLAMGFEVTSVGKFKSFNDRYANPETVKQWAEKYGQSAQKIASFADGTKLNIEMGLVSNATGFLPDIRGMHMPNGVLEDVLGFLRPIAYGGLLSRDGVVDVVSGVNPAGGVFVIGKVENPQVQVDMQYYKMGSGPYYLFYVPYHLPSVQLMAGAAEAVLFHSPVIVPLPHAPLVNVAGFAKRDLPAGTVLDGIGGYMYYGLLDTIMRLRETDFLPVSLAKGAVLNRALAKDDMICRSDVTVSEDTVLWTLYNRQA